MKIKEILERFEKKAENKHRLPAKDLVKELFTHKEYFDFDYERIESDDKIQSYYLTKWLCKYTIVGISLVFYNNKFVALTKQSDIKSDVCVYWKDESSAKMVKDYLMRRGMLFTLGILMGRSGGKSLKVNWN